MNLRVERPPAVGMLRLVPCLLAGALSLPVAADAQDPDPPRPSDLELEFPQLRRGWQYGESAELGRGFYFTRAIFSGGRGWRRGAWSTDFPKADQQFLYVLSNLLDLLDVYGSENPVALDDPQIRRFPFLYALEVGYMNLTEPEAAGLREYLQAGGFLFVDDFWGSREWANFERQIARVLPDRRIEEIPLDHPLFHQFYTIEEVLQVPNVRNGIRGGPTFEQDGLVPHVRGIFDDHGRLMVLINWNTDLGDAWEWSENPYYPFEFSNYAYEMAVNAIIYSMTH